mgnify:CR=1 FL=1
MPIADDNAIDRPSNTNQRGRPTNEKKRQRTEEQDDPIDKFRVFYNDILNTFIDLLSEKFNSDNYKPLMAISSLLISKKKAK